MIIKAREPNTPPTIGPVLDPFDPWDAVGIVVLTTELFPKDCVALRECDDMIFALAFLVRDVDCESERGFDDKLRGELISLGELATIVDRVALGLGFVSGGG